MSSRVSWGFRRIGGEFYMTNDSQQEFAEGLEAVSLEDVSPSDLGALLRAEVVDVASEGAFDVEDLSEEETAEAALALFRTILTEQDEEDLLRDLSVDDVEGPALELRHLAPGETAQECWDVTMRLIGRCSGVYNGAGEFPVPKTISGVIVDGDGEELATWELHRAFVEEYLYGEWSLGTFERVMMETSDTFSPVDSPQEGR